jgi:hypothetical protein
MSPRNAIVCCAVGVLLGVGGMWLLGQPGDAAQPAAARATSGPGDRAAPIRLETTAGARAGEIRTLVAEEVRAALREHAASGPAAGNTPSPEREAQEPTAAFEPARTQVATRIARGAWTATDRDWMRSTLGMVNDAERTELMGQVIAAANRGAIRVELEGPLF